MCCELNLEEIRLCDVWGLRLHDDEGGLVGEKFDLEGVRSFGTKGECEEGMVCRKGDCDRLEVCALCDGIVNDPTIERVMECGIDAAFAVILCVKMHEIVACTRYVDLRCCKLQTLIVSRQRQLRRDRLFKMVDRICKWLAWRGGKMHFGVKLCVGQ